MAHYRIFFLGNDDHIVGVENVDYPTDFDVIANSSSLQGDHPALEIWQQARRVGRFDFRSKDAA